MGTIVAIASVVLALCAAGCIAYIAWELTSEDTPAEKTDEDGPADKQ
jgi:hypothetical protein